MRVLDNGSTGHWENLATVRGDIEVVVGDVRDSAIVTSAARGCQVVFHQAAEVSVPGSIADPRTTYAVNVDGAMNVLLAARDAGCRRVVVASSSAVYGPGPEMPKHEEMPPQPISPYAATKLADEHLCAVFHEAYGLETAALRYFNVYGPRQDPASPYAAAIPKFVQALSAGERPVIYGDGEQTRDFVFVEDVVAANVRAAVAPGAAGMVCNVATGRAATLNAILAMLADVMDVEVHPIYQPGRAGDVRHSAADVCRARERLGFTAAVGLEEGLTRTAAAVMASHTSALVSIH